LKRRTKIFLLVALVVVAAIASIPLFVKANTFRPVIEKQLSAALGRSVKLGDLRLPPFSGRLVAEDVSVADDPNFSVSPFLTAKEIRIAVLLRPLIFDHEVKLRGFEIESPEIIVIRAENGVWNFSSIGRRGAAGAAANTGASSATAKGPAAALPDLSVEEVAIKDARVAVASKPARGESSVYEHVNLMVHDFSFGSQFPFELSADLTAGGSVSATGHLGPINRDDAATSPGDAQISVNHLDPIAAGFLAPDAGASFVVDADVHATSDGQALTTNGTVHLENLKLRKGASAVPKPLDLKYSSTHRLKENTGVIQDVALAVGDSAIHVSGTYEPVATSAEGPLLNLKIAAQTLAIDELQPLMTAAAVRLPTGSVLKGGTLSMNLDAKGQPNALVITGLIALENTRLAGFDIGSKIHGIAALSGVKTGDTTEFERLRAYVRVTNGGVAVRKVEAVIPAMGELSGSGTVSAANQLDFRLMVKVASASGIGKVGVGLLTTLRDLSGGGSGKSGVPVRVSGTSDEPYITADVGSIFGKKK
jgi:AsmA protein